MQSFLRQLVGWIVLACASIAISVALGPETSNPFCLFVNFVLVVLLFLTGYAAFDPWLGPPSHLQHKWPKRPGEHASTGRITCGLTIVLPLVIGLPCSWLLVICLFAGPMDRPDPDEFTAEWFAVWLTIAWLSAGTVVVGASFVGLFALFCGAPLGPGFARVFFLSASALVGAALTFPIIGNSTAGVIGLPFLAAGWFLGNRYAQKLIGFGRCARRWSARCLLVGGLLGGCLAALCSSIVPIGGVIGAIVVANVGALLCARWEEPAAESDSPFRQNKANGS